VTPQPLYDAGRFSHEAVAWLDGVLYETEDRGNAAFYRFLPAREPREAGDLASFGGTLQALVVRGRPNFDANTANPGESYPVEWVTIEEPNPLTDTVRVEAQSKGAAIFDRTEGAWTSDRRCGSTARRAARPSSASSGSCVRGAATGGVLRLVYESTSAADLENPDNVVVVPASGDVFLQEDSDGEQFVRGVTRRGRIYDFARRCLNESGVLRRLLQPRRRDLLPQPAGRPAGRGGRPDADDAARGSARADLRHLGPFDATGGGE
jgi:secreted PhoX family phosphatase